MNLRAPAVAMTVCGVVLASCSSAGSSARSVAGTNTSAAQVSALTTGTSIPVNGLLSALTFRRTCIRDAVTTVCASLIPPGPKSPYAALPLLNLGEPVNGVVVRGKYPGHPKLLSWSFVTNN